MRLSLSSIGLVAVGILATIVRGDDISDIITKTPPCSIHCFLDAITQGHCSIASTEELSNCICLNIPLLSDASTCIQESCSWSDALVARNLTIFTLCRTFPKEERVAEGKNVAIVGLAITIPIVLLRCASRLYSSGRLWWDDYTSLIATVFLIGMLYMQLEASKLGFGLHFWDIEEAPGLSLLKYFWVGQMFYIVVQVFAKISILMLYLRLFQSTWCQRVVKGGIVFMALHGTVFLFCDIFQCTPVQYVFDRTVDGKCLNFTAIVYAGGALSILEDVVLLAIPVPDLWRLRLNTKKKWGLVFMFGIGLVATITSIIRMNFLLKFWDTHDQSWDNVDPVSWSVIEELCAIVCGSLPPCRPLVTAFMPHILSTIGRGTSYISPSLRTRRSTSLNLPRQPTIGGGGAQPRPKASLYRITADIDDLDWRYSRAPPMPGRHPLQEEDELANNRTSTEARLGDPDAIRLKIHSPREVMEKKGRPSPMSALFRPDSTTYSIMEEEHAMPAPSTRASRPVFDGGGGGGGGEESPVRFLQVTDYDSIEPEPSLHTPISPRPSLLRPPSYQTLPESPTIPRPLTMLGVASSPYSTRSPSPISPVPPIPLQYRTQPPVRTGKKRPASVA